MARTLRRLRTCTALSAAAGTVLVAMALPTTAHAQAQAGHDFGDQGQFIFSADRLFPFFSFTSNSTTNNGTNPSSTTTTTGTALSFFWGSNDNLLGDGNSTVYSVPRVGFDYTIIPHLTIGGNLIAFFTLGGSQSGSTGNVSTSTGTPSGNIFGIEPRVGYILGMNDVFSFWLRGGLSYYNANESSNATCPGGGSGSNSKNINVGGLDLDPVVVISPIPHFAFTAGPAFDWGFAGGASTTTQDGQCKTTTTQSFGYNSINFSINGGLLGWF